MNSKARCKANDMWRQGVVVFLGYTLLRTPEEKLHKTDKPSPLDHAQSTQGDELYIETDKPSLSDPAQSTPGDYIETDKPFPPNIYNASAVCWIVWRCIHTVLLCHHKKAPNVMSLPPGIINKFVITTSMQLTTWLYHFTISTYS